MRKIVGDREFVEYYKVAHKNNETWMGKKGYGAGEKVIDMWSTVVIE